MGFIIGTELYGTMGAVQYLMCISYFSLWCWDWPKSLENPKEEKQQELEEAWAWQPPQELAKASESLEEELW